MEEGSNRSVDPDQDQLKILDAVLKLGGHMEKLAGKVDYMSNELKRQSDDIALLKSPQKEVQVPVSPSADDDPVARLMVERRAAVQAKRERKKHFEEVLDNMRARLIDEDVHGETQPEELCKDLLHHLAMSVDQHLERSTDDGTDGIRNLSSLLDKVASGSNISGAGDNGERSRSDGFRPLAPLGQTRSVSLGENVTSASHDGLTSPAVVPSEHQRRSSFGALASAMSQPFNARNSNITTSVVDELKSYKLNSPITVYSLMDFVAKLTAAASDPTQASVIKPFCKYLSPSAAEDTADHIMQNPDKYPPAWAFNGQVNCPNEKLVTILLEMAAPKDRVQCCSLLAGMTLPAMFIRESILLTDIAFVKSIVTKFEGLVNLVNESVEFDVRRMPLLDSKEPPKGLLQILFKLIQDGMKWNANRDDMRIWSAYCSVEASQRKSCKQLAQAITLLRGKLEEMRKVEEESLGTKRVLSQSSAADPAKQLIVRPHAQRTAAFLGESARKQLFSDRPEQRTEGKQHDSRGQKPGSTQTYPRSSQPGGRPAYLHATQLPQLDDRTDMDLWKKSLEQWEDDEDQMAELDRAMTCLAADKPTDGDVVNTDDGHGQDENLPPPAGMTPTHPHAFAKATDEAQYTFESVLFAIQEVAKVAKSPSPGGCFEMIKNEDGRCHLPHGKCNYNHDISVVLDTTNWMLRNLLKCKFPPDKAILLAATMGGRQQALKDQASQPSKPPTILSTRNMPGSGGDPSFR